MRVRFYFEELRNPRRKSQLIRRTFNFVIFRLVTPVRPRVESVKEEPTSPRSSAPEAEQAFDFDFTVLINIESGHCVFYSIADKDKKKNPQSSASSADVSSLIGRLAISSAQ